MKKIIELCNTGDFFMFKLNVPQAAPSKWAFLVAGTWAAYGGYYMTVSCPMFQFSFTIPKLYKGMVEFNVYRIRKAARMFALRFKRTPVYAEWSAYYQVDHVSDRGARKFDCGKDAVEWARGHDEDYDSEVRFGYHWCDESTYLSYKGEDYSRDYLSEAHEDGHPHCVHG